MLAGLTATGPAHAEVQGQIATHDTEGAAGDEIHFSVYLPPGYSTSGSRRFPVVYHLHGMGGAHDTLEQLTNVPESHEAAVGLGIVEPVIIVFPDGKRLPTKQSDTFWADTASGLLAESDVIDAIIPYVDGHFRTLANRRNRIIQGFSMGAFGAAKFAAKFPSLFGGAVLYDGAFVTWDGMLEFHADAARLHFDDSETYFDEYSPYAKVSQNAGTLATSLPFRQVAADLVGGNDTFRNHLLANDVPLTFLSTYEDHDVGLILDAAHPPGSTTTVGHGSWDFIQGVFDGAPLVSSVEFAGVAAHDGWVEEPLLNGNGCGARDAGSATLLVGDAASKCQLRSVFSFDTSVMRDDATLVSASLRVARVGGSGSVGQFGTLRGDVRRGAFGSSASLQAGDFQATATAAGGVPSIAVPGSGSWTTASLNAAGVAAVNRGAGPTQIRLGFATADDGDGTADNVAFASANHAQETARPVLRVVFR